MRNSFGISGMGRSILLTGFREMESANFSNHCSKDCTHSVDQSWNVMTTNTLLNSWPPPKCRIHKVRFKPKSQFLECRARVIFIPHSNLVVCILNKKANTGGWRDDLVIKSTCCSYRRSGFSS